MMDCKTMYEVTRPEYESFVRSLKPDIRAVKCTETPEGCCTRILRKTTNECFCERESFKDGSAEKYYIYILPLHEETAEVQPHRVVRLTTPQQVQKLLDYITKGENK